jgi:hypothetical protein
MMRLVSALLLLGAAGCAEQVEHDEPGRIADGVYDLAVDQATCEVNDLYASSSPVVLARDTNGIAIPTPWPNGAHPPSFAEDATPLVYVAEDAACPGGLVRYTIETTAIERDRLTLAFARIGERCTTPLPACSVRATFTLSSHKRGF